jgi:hypothetical protein
MKLRQIFIVVLFISFILVGTASAFGLGDVMGKSSSASGGGDIDQFNENAKKSESLVNKSTQSLYDAIASKEDQAKVEEMIKKMNETADPKEKNKLQREVTAAQNAIVEKNAKDAQLTKEAATWDVKKKTHVSDALFNYALGAQQAGILVPKGKSIVSSVKSNPLNAAKMATKLDVALDSVTALGGIANGSVNTISALKTFMSAANISVKLPTSTTDKPKDMEGGI